jgi:hypothetical protein
LTKPLQGMAFRKMRSKLMNFPVNYDKEEEIEKEMTKQNKRGTETGTKTTTEQVASMSPQECVLGISNLKRLQRTDQWELEEPGRPGKYKRHNQRKEESRNMSGELTLI